MFQKTRYYLHDSNRDNKSNANELVLSGEFCQLTIVPHLCRY